MLLLQKRYAAANPHALQLVPDRHSGDLGLEAFSHDGSVYQCYAAQEPISIPECYAKQRDKLTADLAKLRAKSTDLAGLLGAVVIKRYVFMVHRHDARQLITHANVKAAEVVGWGLPFIAADFYIVIETLDNYAVEQKELHAVPAPIVEATPVDDEFASIWAESNMSLMDTAAAKLEKIIPSDNTRAAVLSSLLNQYLEGDNALEKLKATSPDSYQAVLRSRSSKEGMLVLEHPPTEQDSHANLKIIADELSVELRGTANLDKATADKFAWAAVTDWLMRCPLDFGGAE